MGVTREQLLDVIRVTFDAAPSSVKRAMAALDANPNLTEEQIRTIIYEEESNG